MKHLTFDELAAQYCERQQQTPHGLRLTLEAQRERYAPDGWMLLECVMMDSSRLGSLTILPYGPRNTYQQRLEEGVPISPRGLASDMSLCIGWIESGDLK